MMLHLILLVLCWIFVAVAMAAAATMRASNADPRLIVVPAAVDFIGQAALMGTPIWLVLEGAYYLAVTYVF